MFTVHRLNRNNTRLKAIVHWKKIYLCVLREYLINTRDTRDNVDYHVVNDTLKRRKKYCLLIALHVCVNKCIDNLD